MKRSILLKPLGRGAPRLNQSGIVSIIVTIVLILVISLLVLSFSKVIRREQSIQLDRQLSSRAFYAAESGVNLAIQKINEKGRTEDKNSCTTDSASGDGEILPSELILDAASDTRITCLLIDQTPDRLEYSSISDSSTVIGINAKAAVAGGVINEVEFTWANETPSTDSCADMSNGFPAATGTQWKCGDPILRVDLVNIEGYFDRDNLQSSLISGFLYPVRPVLGNPEGYTGKYARNTADIENNKGILVPGICNADECTATISGLSDLVSLSFAARVMSLYGQSTLTIKVKDASGNAMDLYGNQAVIDSTGIAQGVLRRIKVRIPLDEKNSNYQFPDFAIAAADICKQLQIAYSTTNLCDPPGQRFDGIGM